MEYNEEEWDDIYEEEDYNDCSFHEYLLNECSLKNEQISESTGVEWDVYGDAYVKFCIENAIEIIDFPLWMSEKEKEEMIDEARSY